MCYLRSQLKTKYFKKRGVKVCCWLVQEDEDRELITSLGFSGTDF